MPDLELLDLMQLLIISATRTAGSRISELVSNPLGGETYFDAGDLGKWAVCGGKDSEC